MLSLSGKAAAWKLRVPLGPLSRLFNGGGGPSSSIPDNELNTSCSSEPAVSFFGGTSLISRSNSFDNDFKGSKSDQSRKKQSSENERCKDRNTRDGNDGNSSRFKSSASHHDENWYADWIKRCPTAIHSTAIGSLIVTGRRAKEYLESSRVKDGGVYKNIIQNSEYGYKPQLPSQSAMQSILPPPDRARNVGHGMNSSLVEVGLKLPSVASRSLVFNEATIVTKEMAPSGEAMFTRTLRKAASSPSFIPLNSLSRYKSIKPGDVKSQTDTGKQTQSSEASVSFSMGSDTESEPSEAEDPNPVKYCECGRNVEGLDKVLEFDGYLFNVIGLDLLQKKLYSEAFQHFKRASEVRYPKAQFNLGMCYFHGYGTTSDLATAIHYWELAAIQNHGMALYQLAALEIRTELKSKSDDSKQVLPIGNKGIKLMRRAAKAGVREAKEYLDKLSK